jgi:hypothetical protein
MSKKEKPLPKPSSTPFGIKRPSADNEKTEPLMADRIAMAMSEGKLDEYLQKEMPNNEHARKLAEMMMGMTGMMPAGNFPGKKHVSKKDSHPQKTDNKGLEDKKAAAQPTEDIVNAAQTGDVNGLVELLEREHNKRSGNSDSGTAENKKTNRPSSSTPPLIDRKIIDKFIKIASENNLNLDWLLLRAIKRYVQDYKKTGNL